MRLRWAALVLLMVLTGMLLNCSSSATPIGTPVITTLFPDSIVAGSATFILTVNGLNFSTNPPAVALWNGSPRTTAVNPSTGQLKVTIPASDLTNTGVGLVSVVNPTPGGMTQSPASFNILPLLKGAATITSLNPASANPGTKGPLLLTVNGTGFITGSIIRWNGAFRQPDAVSPTALTTNLTTNDLAFAGIASVSVDNPLAGGVIASSISVDFTIGSGMAAFPQVISVSAFGGPANGRSSAPSISADGRFVVFYSEASNLVGGSASGNIFVRDTCLGSGNCTPKTSPVDVSPEGGPPDARSQDTVTISDDGRFVAFASYAGNLVPGLSDSVIPPGSGHLPVSRLSIYMRDMCAGVNLPEGCTPHTEIITRDVHGQRAYGQFPSISADGRFVAFNSGAPNLVPGTAMPQTYLYVRDACLGLSALVKCGPSTYPVSPQGSSAAGDSQTVHPVISGSGRYVAYQVWTSPNRLPALDAPSQIFVHDTCLGRVVPPSCVPSTVRISMAPDGSPLASFNGQPSLSSDGRFVVFESRIVDKQFGPSPATRNIFLRDTCLGGTTSEGCIPSTKLIYSRSEGNPASMERVSPTITGSGRFISFVARAAGALPDIPGTGSFFVYDTCFGAPVDCKASTYPVAALGTGPNAQALTVDKLTNIPLTADGRFAAFYSQLGADPWMPVSGQGDVFLTVTSFK